MIVRCASCAVLVALPLVAISTAAPSASATTVNVGAPTTASCTASGGKDVFEYPIGIPGSSSSYVPPSVNNGQVITVDHIHLSCTSSRVPHQTLTELSEVPSPSPTRPTRRRSSTTAATTPATSRLPAEGSEESSR